MTDCVLVVATHLDDETLGCGGTLLRHKARGDEIHWMVVTEPTLALGYDARRLGEWQTQLERVGEMYGFSSIHRLGFPAADVDRVSARELISAISSVLEPIKPSILYLPFAYDVHNDHRSVFSAAYSSAKNFRAPYVRRILMMEVVSETDFGIPSFGTNFVPNVFIDVSQYFDTKLKILSVFHDQLAAHPFPRSLEHVDALALHRGAAAGCHRAEAFVLIKEIS